MTFAEADVRKLWAAPIRGLSEDRFVSALPWPPFQGPEILTIPVRFHKIGQHVIGSIFEWYYAI
jgi:hypothetical protein